MPSKYCAKGHKNNYSPGEDPNFCSTCGTSFGGFTGSKVVSTKPVRPLPKKAASVTVDDDEEYDEDDEDNITQASDFDVPPFQIEVEGLPRLEKLDLNSQIGIHAGQQPMNFGPRAPKLNKKQVKARVREIWDTANSKRPNEIE